MRLTNLLLTTLLLFVSVFARSQKSNEFTVLQWNVWQEGTMVPGGYDAIVNEIVRLKPDFVTFSEVRNYNKTNFTARVCASLKEKGLSYYSFYSYDSGLLSKHPITDSSTIFPIQNDHGTIYKMKTTVGKQVCAVYTAHLDYLNDTYYEVRGYDGNNWHKMEAPLTDVPTILERNNLSLRDDAIRAFIKDAQKEIEEGNWIFLGGDFNEPSHFDWIETTKDSADHHEVVVPWPVTTLLHEAGFKDSYREKYPNPVTHPGYTYPSDNLALPPNKITWTPDADERDRIDYIFYYPRKGLHLKEAAILGPKTSIRRSQRVAESGQDVFIEPLGVWPTDHKAVWVNFQMR